MTSFLIKLPLLIFGLIRVTIEYLQLVINLWRMDKEKKEKVLYDFHVKSNTHLSPIKYNEVGVTIGSWEMYKYIIRKQIDLELYGKYCQVGLPAPNPSVIEVRGKISNSIKQKKSLLSFANSARPLVINFGSYIVDFITIYISEAHATDQWQFATNPFKVRSHRSLDERITATFLLRKEYEKYGWTESMMKISADPMNNEARKMYTALPERFGVIRNEKIEFLSKVGSEFYVVSKLEEWLQAYRLSLNQ
ncbi:DgyrCDS9653 [Dimorphilus gyrociliatus]|uniref:Iodothyronine deiodinase n=1 Tax=Dimorphilus gyrociliatus TaxID=2664684 RepID=A0A7I8VZ04_9ANNE|nr:DgyrCDS9653 [Dimorphilus gyrociliatus]